MVQPTLRPPLTDNFIDKGLEVFEKHQRARHVETDPVSFVGGFMTCFGIITGRVEVGFPHDRPLSDLFDRLQRDLEDYRSRVVGAQQEEMRRGG